MRRWIPYRLLGRFALGAAVLVTGAVWSGPAAAEPLSFNRDIRPILSEHCFQCHGPDPAARKAKLRLDQPEAAMADLDGHAAIVPGHPEQSALVARITQTDPDEIMPPPSAKKPLSAEQIAKLQTWIAEGADWPSHWAFVPPVRPALPAVQRTDWVRNPIDTFVLAKLEQEGLTPSPEADPVTLLRRLSLDLVGLPPGLDDINAFLGGDLETAYAAATERLLASPHYGERWARDWLDAAQYADSDGFEKDKPRQVYAWRDWVINAFNADMPYDEFVIDQVAGDLLPGATQDQRVATGFLRNSMVNEEGGIDPEQFRMEAMFSRVDVVGRAVLGLTVNCAQCHSHKYDPLTHTEYYRLLSYLNNSYEACMTVYSPEEQAKRAEVEAAVAAREQQLRDEYPAWQDAMQSWETGVRAQPAVDWQTLTLSFDDTSSGGQKCNPVGDGSYVAQGYAPTRFHPKSSAPSPLTTITAVRLELLTNPNLPRNGPGRSIYGTAALSEFELRMAPADQSFETFDQWERVPIAYAVADVNPPRRPLGPEFPDRGTRNAVTGPISMAIDGDQETAWTTDIDPGTRNQSRYAIFKLKTPLQVPAGSVLGFKLSQNHGGWNSDDNQNFNIGCFRLSVTDAEVLPGEAIPEEVRALVARGPAGRSEAETEKVFQYWRTTVPELMLANLKIASIWQTYPVGTTQLVYDEMDVPRTSHRLERGDFLHPAEAVTPGVPTFLNPLPADAPPNRLGLARWLVDPRAPTTARAFVNRVWLHYFGTGLVATPSDLGLQGDPPSHPELLDWLAVEFMESGWDVKHLQRLITSSATYRQSSAVTPALLKRDRANRLLARGARFRVEGEIVRDIALAASGLLNPEVGGPSVYPPAPMSLFEPPASYGPKTWKIATGPERYRRALYTFRFRSVPHPALQAFDTPPGDSPCVGRLRSNTPLQALTTLNEAMYLECARALAAETLNEGGNSDAGRLDYAFRRCTARAPSPEELATLDGFLKKQRTRLNAGALDAQVILALGDDVPPVQTAASETELAAWTLAARVILNLDETITRQ